MLNKFHLLGLVIVCISAKAQNISGSYQPMADKVEEYANALQNAIYSFIKRENK